MKLSYGRLTAHHLRFGRPLAIVRADSVVSSFLSETAANLRKVFDFILASPVVAPCDEFDALGRSARMLPSTVN